MTHPRHLIEDGRKLHHCTANRFDHDFINRLRRRPNKSEAPFTLSYWQHIVDGRSRFFAFMRDGAPVLTIEYAVRPANISHIQGFARSCRRRRCFRRSAAPCITAARP